jgi:hypothetical protein
MTAMKAAATVPTASKRAGYLRHVMAALHLALPWRGGVERRQVCHFMGCRRPQPDDVPLNVGTEGALDTGGRPTLVAG